MVKLFYSLTNGIAIFVYTLTNGKAALTTDKWVLSWRDIDSDLSSIVKLRYHNDIPEACSAEQVLTSACQNCTAS